MVDAEDSLGQLELRVAPRGVLKPEELAAVANLCNRAFEENLTEQLRGLEGTHVLGYVDGRLVSHAMWVTRWLQVGEGPLLRTAYVEAVATDANHRRRGFAAAVMRRLASEIQDYDIAALSPFSLEHYAKLGWEPWQGPLYCRGDGGVTASPEDEDVMVYRLPKTPDVDVTEPLSVEWREGEVW